jgi:hypothetical protein
MKKFFLCCAFSFAACLIGNSQSAQFGDTGYTAPVFSGEKIRLFSDRSVYCVKEKICFTAEYSCVKELDSLVWSTVLYIELIRWNGAKLAQSVEKLSKPGISGNIQIPDNLPSGNYYLRAYTKWMRNFPPENYAYIRVKIVNPFKAETDEGPTETSALPGAPGLSPEPKSMVNGVTCRMDKNEIRPNEKAELVLRLNDKRFLDRYCVSVAKIGAVDTTSQSVQPETGMKSGSQSFAGYLPELRGITISGEIVDKSTKLPLKDVPVSLSEPQNAQCFSVYRTNETGRFVFSLPDMPKRHDFFVRAESEEAQSAEIRLDDGFCRQPVRLPYIGFSLNNNEKRFSRDMFQNLQLGERFMTGKDTLTEAQSTKAAPIPFYGNKKKVYYTRKYIDLPNIEEFVFELVMEATILREKGKSSQIILRRTDGLDYPVLILVDNVPVNNDEKLLKIPLNRIERIEVIDRDYMVGIQQYKGIISIYSKDKDFAGLNLGKNGVFFTYDLFSDKNPGYSSVDRLGNSRMPDLRNFLYWNPDVQLSADQNTNISFYTSDDIGDYVVLIREKNSTDTGEVYGKCFFSVK